MIPSTRILNLLLPGLLMACASVPSRPTAPANTVSDAIDVHVHVVFDQGEAEKMSQVRPPTPASVQKILLSERFSRVGAIVIAPRGAEATTKLNDALFAFVKTNPKLFAIASVHPLDGESALVELERVARLGARMIKIHQNTQKFDLEMPEVNAVVSKAGSVGLPVLLEGTALLDPKTFGKVVILAASNPKSKIVVAHMGFADFRQMAVFAQLRSYPWWPNNVYFDCSAIVPFYVDSPVGEELKWMIRTLGTNRVMFGSDFPVYEPNAALDALSRMGFSAPEVTEIASGTAKTLLGL